VETSTNYRYVGRPRPILHSNFQSPHNFFFAVLAFGQDEKISRPRGANNIGKYLEQKYGWNGISMIVDEGGMDLETVYGKEFALPGIAEKGYLVSVRFRVSRYILMADDGDSIHSI
jgi:hypothetical protein